MAYCELVSCWQTAPCHHSFEGSNPSQSCEVDTSGSQEQQKSLDDRTLSLAAILKMFQRSSTSSEFFTTPHMRVGNCAISSTSLSSTLTTPLVIIELMEMDAESAKKRIRMIAASGRLANNPIAVISLLNSRISASVDMEGTFSSSDESFAVWQKLTTSTRSIADCMHENRIAGACFPMQWWMEQGGSYPYLEARSILRLHPDVQPFFENPLVISRWMDADVTKDPLFSSLDSEKERIFQDALSSVSRGVVSVFSGGYRFDSEELKQNEMRQIVDTLNAIELEVREKLYEWIGFKSIYWPEPNLYTNSAARLEGALKAWTWVMDHQKEPQQQESTYVIKGSLKGIFRGDFAVTKSLKRHLEKFWTSYQSSNTLEELESSIIQVHQTHMNAASVQKIMVWNGGAMSSAIDQISRDHLRQCAKALKLLKQAS